MQAVQTIHEIGLPNPKRRPQVAIWLALGFAIVLHIFLVLLPVMQKFDSPEINTDSIEVQLVYAEAEPETIHKPIPPVEPASTRELPPELQDSVTPEAVTQTPLEPLPASEPVAQQPVPQADRQFVPETPDLQQLGKTILSRQFISEESVTEKIFGPAIPEPPAEAKEFHFPHKPNMITMLDRPVPNLPFEYTEDLIHFAYEPGVKGDLQRFWDDITPEFGWRTKYGTEVKCVWVLVVAACGWGRSK